MIGLSAAGGATMAHVFAGLAPLMDDPAWLPQCVKKAEAEG